MEKYTSKLVCIMCASQNTVMPFKWMPTLTFLVYDCDDSQWRRGVATCASVMRVEFSKQWQLLFIVVMAAGFLIRSNYTIIIVILIKPFIYYHYGSAQNMKCRVQTRDYLDWKRLWVPDKNETVSICFLFNVSMKSGILKWNYVCDFDNLNWANKKIV